MNIVFQGNLPVPHFHTPINVGTLDWSTLDSTVWDGGYLWYKVLYTACSFVYMAAYDLQIKLV